MNLPNKLSLARICLIPVFVALFYVRFPYHYVVSAAVFILAACTDFIDGHIARKYNMVTNLGKFLDPIADKVLVSTAFIVMLTDGNILFPSAGEFWLPLWGVVVAVILARELIISGFRTVAASRNLVLAADKIGKIKTVFQDSAIAVLLVGGERFFPSMSVDPVLLAGVILLAVAALLTVVSGVNYVVKNFAVLKEEK
ncbi:MAG: CDP-diacylglycerol--glycerol-3-phosphate 3-phosphatidyltransferase [Bacillota bacterium]|nr:MAG: CDP-diacylglycerol--glycerol-3-phosphate 3-phosphatidyltransferase [Bacillota bacterium]